MKKPMLNYITREKFDNLYTPPIAIKPLLKYLPKNLKVWECCDFGKSEITKLLKNEGYEVLSTDIEENFLKYEPKEHYDIIITNPPYSLKNEFLKRCYELKKPFCLLLPLTTLEGKERNKLFKKYGIEVLVLDKRINFMKWTFKDYKNSSNWFNTSWFCYNVLPQQLIFESLGEENEK